MKKVLILGLMIFVISCTPNIPSQTKSWCMCEPIYGHATDWDNISDDLARNIYRHNLMCEELR
ncbi:MAG: hypothetical protein K6B71_02365 [Alphaproteobacteria bacterium]|nr:hypothetical protein [Alphaproteobacteria bacterium]